MGGKNNSIAAKQFNLNLYFIMFVIFLIFFILKSWWRLSRLQRFIILSILIIALMTSVYLIPSWFDDLEGQASSDVDSVLNRRNYNRQESAVVNMNKQDEDIEKEKIEKIDILKDQAKQLLKNLGVSLKITLIFF